MAAFMMPEAAGGAQEAQQAREKPS